MSTFPRFPGTKDPNDNGLLLTFRAAVPVADPVASVSVTEVDENDIPVVSPALTIGTVQVDVNAGYTYATCSCSGGVANPVVTPGVPPDPKLYLLRSRWTFASGKPRDKTMRLYVAHN